MDVTYFASYREDACGVASRAIIKEQGIFTCRSFGIWPAMPHRLEQIAGPMSALPPKADIRLTLRHVRFVPKADSCSARRLTEHVCNRSGHGPTSEYRNWRPEIQNTHNARVP